MQSFTSRNTSINSNRLPAVYKRILTDQTPRTIFDFGCGRFTDRITDSLPDNITYIPYDPFNQPHDVNERGVRFLNYISSIQRKTPLDIVCSNVLNVIDDDGVVSKIARMLMNVHNNTGCGIYVSVYEGDRSGVGRQTGRDQYQRNEPLRAYQKLFPGSSITNRTIFIERESS